MATTTFRNICVLTAVVFLSSFHYGATAKYKPFPQPQITKLTVYWHDITGGSNATSINIIQPVANQKNFFGSVQMFDNPLTRRPQSEELGRAQGLYGSDSLGEFSLIMLMNFVFTAGEYNGSTITIMGKNTVSNTVREMSVVGGTGVFRMGRGYALARTYKFNATEAIVRYDVRVMH